MTLESIEFTITVNDIHGKLDLGEYYTKLVKAGLTPEDYFAFDITQYGFTEEDRAVGFALSEIYNLTENASAYYSDGITVTFDSGELQDLYVRTHLSERDFNMLVLQFPWMEYRKDYEPQPPLPEIIPGQGELNINLE